MHAGMEVGRERGRWTGSEYRKQAGRKVGSEGGRQTEGGS